MKKYILCDLDGTLADVRHRLHYIKGQKKDWDSFHKACVDDPPYEDVIEIAMQLANCDASTSGYGLHILSGRNDTVRGETEEWLRKHGVVYEGLHMRKASDRRPDPQTKAEMARELGFTPDNVLCVLDDRQCVVDMWRENGYRCLQVQAWKE